MLIQDWDVLARTLGVTALAYAALLVAVRAGGKRTLAKLNAFDWIVTVAFGSALASVATGQDVSVAEGAVVFAGLVALQYLIAWLSTRVPRFQRLVKAQPVLLVRDGRLLEDRMRRTRVTDVEIFQALRQEGLASVSDAAAVVLETNGALSVLTRASGDADAMRNVAGWPDQRAGGPAQRPDAHVHDLRP